MSAKYEVICELGRGAMGIVYRAKQVDLDREVALKVLPVEAKDSLTLQRFKREVRIACGLSHPHIVHIYDGGDLDGRPFYAMEIVRGEELASVVARGPQSFADVVRWAEQGADALAYIHAQQLSHRDLKPGNVMINEAHDLIVMDFGLAKDPTGTLLTEEGAVVGTPRYIAPEGYRGEEPGQPQDVYALALCMHEALIGRSWDVSKSVPELAKRVLDGPPPTLAGRPEVPAWFVEIEARALVKDPAQRITAAQYRDFLKRRGRGVVSRATRVSGPLPRASAITDGAGRTLSSGVPTSPPARRPVLALAAAVFVAGLAAAALWRRPAAPPPAAAAVPSLAAPTWPAHRQARFAAANAPAGSELVIRAGQKVWRGPAPAHTLTLPPALDATVTLELGGTALAGPLGFKTPTLVPTARVYCQPSDVEALVDFDLEEPAAVTVNIYRADGQRAGHTEQAAGERYFSHWFTGLRPATEYRIEVLTPSGWGGFSGFGFRTEALKQTTAVQEASRLIRSSPELVEYCLSVANKVPDRRMVPALLDWVRSDHPSVAAQMKKAAWVAEKTRSRELAGELAKRTTDASEESLARYVLNAMGHTRHPDAPAFGRRFLGKWDEGDSFVNAVKCLAVAPSPARVAEVEPHLKRYREVVRVIEWIVRCDRPAAHALFRRLLAGSDHSQDSMTHFACEGLAFLHDDADVPLLESIVGLGDAKDFARGIAVRTLVTLGSPAARAAIARALPQAPACLELVSAAGLLGLTELTPIVRATFQTSTGRAKKEAAGALGLLGDLTSAPALVAALDDPAPEVRGAAAWALGRMNATTAAVPLRDHASQPTAGDAPLFALGLLAAPEATASLARMLEDQLIATDRSRSALVEWARRRTTGERLGPTSYPLFGGATYDRTDLHVEPGDVLKASVSGIWRFGSNKDDTPTRTQLMSNGTRTSVRAVVGDQVLLLEKTPTYYFLSRGGDVLLTPRDWPPSHLNAISLDEPRGFAVVHLEPQS